MICEKVFKILLHGFSKGFAAVLLAVSVSAQTSEKVEGFAEISTSKPPPKCRKFAPGKIVVLPVPAYPTAARDAKIGGAVEFEVSIDRKGAVTDLKNSRGSEIFMDTAAATALRAKFSPTLCAGRPVETEGFIVYNFLPGLSETRYFKPKNVSDFPDVSPNSEFYEPILALTENYDLTYGYADKNFYPQTPLNKGDFLHFLRLTLDFLERKSVGSKKIPHEIGLYFPFNPHSIKRAGEIRDFSAQAPYAESLRFLVSKYDIAPVDEAKNLQGGKILEVREVKEIWEKIFGAEAVPVNFRTNGHPRRILTRGEFALFLRESLYVLDYKLMP